MAFKMQQNKRIASSSSPPSPQSSLSRTWIHDLFPSFHGADVRESFLSHIMKEFRSKGINPFIDNEIKRGEFIGPELKKAIQGSKIALVLLSKNYASSSWCLDELVEIMRCKEDLGQEVVAIFYEVDPTDVKKQTRDFGKVFAKTCKGKSNEVIRKWRGALEKVATVAGYHSKNWKDEATMIEDISTDISNMLNVATPTSVFGSFIGMEDHMTKIEPLLRLDMEEEVRMIGIWGPPGIGKSTIVRCLFTQHSGEFPFRAIMVDIRRSYQRSCLDEGSAQLQLQSQMLTQMLNHNKDDIVIHDLGVAKKRLKDKKVFLVLDDVDRSAQLVALAKEIRWFGRGSRIIITTENLRVLKAHGINHIYKVDFPTNHQAFQMFCMYAFDQKYPKYGFKILAWQVTNLVGELPLGLKVMGSYFRGRSMEEWEKAIPNLQSRLDGDDKDIESILQFSYDALSEDDKYLFLHIACFFNGEEIEKAVEHLIKIFPNVRHRLDVLAEKSLIYIERDLMEMKYERIKMHTLLEKLGKDIVRNKYIHDPGQRQFLVDDGEIRKVLMVNEGGSRNVIGIKYNGEGELYISERSFKKMYNLQFLYLDGPSKTCHQCYLPPQLRYLHWPNFPMTRWPSDFDPKFLMELSMPFSKFEKLWKGNKLLLNLKWMDLSYSYNLKELPNLSTVPNLQKLDLSGCLSLKKLPYSIGNATNLQKLVLRHCLRLVKLPSSIGNATNLQKLDLSGCSSLKKLSSSIGNATNLQKLVLKDCSRLVKLPSSIGNAINLQKLDLSGCSSLKELPSSIGNATNLQKLVLKDCSRLVKLPSSIGNATNLQNLDLSGCSSLRELPSSIGNATNLQELVLEGCSRLVNLPSSINATSLKKLVLRGCSSLVELSSSIGYVTKLQDLDLGYHQNLVELPSSIGNATHLKLLTFDGCSNLVEIPAFIGNLDKLRSLTLIGCSKLEVLPANVNLKWLVRLDLSGCSSLKSFPEISTNVSQLNLSGTAIEEVPPLVKGFSRLCELILRGCKELLSLPQLPDSLEKLDAENCESLERLDSSFRNPDDLNFDNCFKLNKEARDLIIQSSKKHGVTRLPGKEIPTYFTHRGNGGSLVVELNERPFPSSSIFKACILLVKEETVYTGEEDNVLVYGIKTDEEHALPDPSFHKLDGLLTEHLYIFEFEEADVTWNKIFFEFLILSQKWVIKECGVHIVNIRKGLPSDSVDEEEETKLTKDKMQIVREYSYYLQIHKEEEENEGENVEE